MINQPKENHDSIEDLKFSSYTDSLTDIVLQVTNFFNFQSEKCRHEHQIQKSLAQ